MQFSFDQDLGIYLPQPVNFNSLNLNLNRFEYVELIDDANEITEKLEPIVGQNYFEKNVQPFIENRLTQFKTAKLKFNPIKRINDLLRYGKPFFTGQYEEMRGYDFLSKSTKNMDNGDFVYIASKEKIFVFNLSKRDGNIMMDNRYPLTNNLLWFSNNLVDYIETASGLKPYIINSIGKEQSPTTNLFHGEPEIITNDIDKALKHFKRSDFGYLKNILEQHYEKIKK